MNEIQAVLAAINEDMKDEMITDLLIMLSRISLQQSPPPPPGTPELILLAYCRVKSKQEEAQILADDAIAKAMHH